MCGIAGFAGFDNEPLLRSMVSSLAHRGPDDAGYFVAPGIGLGMRRLAIIDLKTGNQPIANETKDVWVVFNGEIYNYDDLRRNLAKGGHNLSTSSDTETIVHLYEDHGIDFVHHLRGMFGIALWDVKRSRLVLARDRIGEKPLYYSIDGEWLYFGSEIKTILQAGRARNVNPQAVCDFLAAGYVTGKRTFYDDVYRIPPGYILVWEKGNVTLQQYWRNKSNNLNNMTFETVYRDLSERLSDTVCLCLKSDVEVGAFLSGGIDSSAVVALMRKHEASVQTFSVGYDGLASGFNELHYARKVSSYLGTQHHELILGPHSSMDLLPRILWHYDEPHGEPTSVLVYLLCEFTRKRVKVALSGTGGDEIFFGYPRHAGIRYLEYYRLLPKVFRKQLIDRIVGKWPESTRGNRFAKRVKRFISGSELPPAQAYLSWISLLQRDVREKLISEEVRRLAPNPAGDDFLMEHLMGNGNVSLLDRAASLDIEGYLPEYQLAYMDRMSMAHGLEVRAPLCDYELVKYVTSLPASFRLRGNRSKFIFKEIAKQWIPREIVERKKVGFDSPIGQWFKGELRGFLMQFLSRENVECSGLLDGETVQALIGDHISGRKDYSLQLWSIVALEGWYRMYIEDRITDGSGYQIADLRGAGGKAASAAQSIE